MKDILLDSMNDLAVKNGDFDIQHSDIQKCIAAHDLRKRRF